MLASHVHERFRHGVNPCLGTVEAALTEHKRRPDWADSVASPSGVIPEHRRSLTAELKPPFALYPLKRHSGTLAHGFALSSDALVGDDALMGQTRVTVKEVPADARSLVFEGKRYLRGRTLASYLEHRLR